MQLDTSERVSSIKQALATNSDEKAKGAVRKFIPTSQHVYGVRLPLLNQIAKAFHAKATNWRREFFLSGVRVRNLR